MRPVAVQVKYVYDEETDDYVWHFVDDEGSVIGALSSPNLEKAFLMGVKYEQQRRRVSNDR